LECLFESISCEGSLALGCHTSWGVSTCSFSQHSNMVEEPSEPKKTVQRQTLAKRNNEQCLCIAYSQPLVAKGDYHRGKPMSAQDFQSLGL
jgi:hypothetical protein